MFFSLGIVSGMYSSSEEFSSVVISKEGFLRASSCEGGFPRVMASASGLLCVISTEEDTSNASSCSRYSRLSEVRGFKGALMSLLVSTCYLFNDTTYHKQPHISGMFIAILVVVRCTSSYDITSCISFKVSTSDLYN